MTYLMLLLLLLNEVSNSDVSDSLKYSQLENRQAVKYLTFRKDDRHNSVGIRDINFGGRSRNVFIIHGYLTSTLDKPLKLKDDLFQYDEVDTVIIISWTDYSTNFSGPSSVISGNPIAYFGIADQHVPSLAKDLSQKIWYIHRNGAEKIELIGFGMGAHVAGQAGKLLTDKGYALDRIVGLDPVGLYFQGKSNMSLQVGDAKDLMIIHTNAGGYGFSTRISDDDKFINGGKKQPNCKSKLTDDVCSHNEAWEAYSNHLKEKRTDEMNEIIVQRDETINERDETDPIHPFIICLDISTSMNEDDRWTRAINAVNRAISSMDDSSYLGIVVFNETGHFRHNIIQIKGIAEKESLISSLPDVPDGATSIGAGLRLSMNMIQDMSNGSKLCSSIFLISDGSQNSGETPQDVLPDLQSACVQVNSIGLGAHASEDLEEISAKTNGIVAYAKEDGTSQQIVGIIQAFSYSFDMEMDADDRAIYLPTKMINLSYIETIIPYFIDKSIGNHTEFSFISYDVENVDVRLTSPDGQEYTSADPEYEYDQSVYSKGFRIGVTESGQWNLTITRARKMRRSIRSTYDATIMAKSHQLHENVSTIRLDATVSSRTLEYPNNSITIKAELRSDRFPVIQAQAAAYIQGLNFALIKLPLLDNGAFPDELADDGIYTANVVTLPNVERYTVLVTAVSNGTANLVPIQINYLLREAIDCNRLSCQLLEKFERETNVGSIKLQSKEIEDKISPHPVNDLRGMVEEKDETKITLEWTSPVNEILNVKIKRYDIRILINDTRFEHALAINENHVIDGSLDATNSTTGKLERIVLKIPDHIWKFVKVNSSPRHVLQFGFALKAIGANDTLSERSNIASVIIKERLIATNDAPISPVSICDLWVLPFSFGDMKVKQC